MADILTHLRELSFGYSILNKGNLSFSETPESFIKFCKAGIENTNELTRRNISEASKNFSPNELSAINNGLKLGKYILEKNIITSNSPNVKWLGNFTKSGTAADIEIDNIPFSLKEDSFILNNMGLYQLINIITDKVHYKQGLHIFEEFSPVELNNWFKVTRDRTIEMLKKESFSTLDRSNKNIKLAYTEELLYLFFNGIELKIHDFANCEYERFKKETTGKLREKVFSKFINNVLSHDNEYLMAKKVCAEKSRRKIKRFFE